MKMFFGSKKLYLCSTSNNLKKNCPCVEFLIIGAGGVGTVVAHKVAKNKVFTDIMLASRTKSKCDEIAAAVGG